MNTTGQTEISGLAPLIEKLPFVEKTLLYADLFDLSPPHQPHTMRLFYDWTFMREHITTWLAACLIAGFLASSCFLDGPTEEQAAQDVAADVQDAIKTAQVQR